MFPIDLSGQVALVTGSARGIGRTSALWLAKAGCDVVVTWASNRDAGEKLVRDVEALGRQALLQRCDVADTSQIDATVTAGIERFGKIDILVANAGVGIASPASRLVAQVTTTSQPALASHRALVRPMPRAEPVTNATWPARSIGNMLPPCGRHLCS